MNAGLFDEFLVSNDKLRVYSGDKLIFTSSKDGLLSLLEYMAKSSPLKKGVTVFDRVVGNAAALLLERIFCGEVYSPLASELAVKTLRHFGIDYHFTEIVPYIRGRGEEGMCPMEKLSLGKSPEEFYRVCLSLDLGHGF
jgi:hypothetical protein